MYLGSGSPSRKLPVPTMRSIRMTEGCGSRRRSLFRGKEEIGGFPAAEEGGFWGLGLICCGGEEEESGLGGRVELATMGFFIDKQYMASEFCVSGSNDCV